MTDKKMRSSQLISPFGAGAVVELSGESFTCMDTTQWPVNACIALPTNTLGRMLQKTIRRPPIEEQKTGAVPFSRFPRWLFCPTCRRLTHYKHALDKAHDFKTPTCQERDCKHTALVPMRFVIVCEEGHLADVDWYWWAHRNVQQSQTGQCTKQTGILKFRTTGASGGDFDSMVVECACGARNSLEGLTDKPYPLGCKGKQPWQYGKFHCTASPRVHPRGASNIYFPMQLSALDLASDLMTTDMVNEKKVMAWLPTYVLASSMREACRIIQDWKNMPNLYQPVIDEACRNFGLSSEIVKPVVLDFLEGKEEANLAESIVYEDKSQHGIITREWPVLSRALAIQSEYLRTKPIALSGVWPASYSAVWKQVTLINRLREVRALVGFRRLKPDKLVHADLTGESDWLPGVELFGEGIFLVFNEDLICAWEKTAAREISSRLAELKGACERWDRKPTEVYASARFIALHTFAHGLIRRLAFDAGYSSSSLRERIYCGAPGSSMAGILIYTSDGDSEGSLGGLVRQGEPERLLGTIMRTIADLSWCSSDPVCSETEKQGIDAMNAAACHACCLVSETSCMYNNSLLDRRLLIGSDEAKITGLLEELALEAV